MPRSAALRTPFVLGVLGLACAAGCGSTDLPESGSEPTAVRSSAIQGGTADTTHSFAVGIAHATSSGVSLCSGVLLAPNLVATARHCVSTLASDQVDCSTSMFGSTFPAADILVTADPSITHNFIKVTDIVVPSGSPVCGNDIAFLILSTSISLPQYVTPTINPPMTDRQAYTTAVTAIGYGVDMPATGSGAGVRRIRQNIKLVCIPNDSDPSLNCSNDPQWAQIGKPNEFEGGDGTCEGDSGSGAFEQANFDNGKWVAFGVLSRGGVNADGGTCRGSIYSRFDAWPDLLIGAADKAAATGGYGPPTWTNRSSQGVACLKEGAACQTDTACCSGNCISHDQTSYACVACDCNNPCNVGYNCQQGVCALGAPAGDAGACVPASAGGNGGGCAVGRLEAQGPVPSLLVGAFGATTFAVARRRRRRRRRRA